MFNSESNLIAPNLSFLVYSMRRTIPISGNGDYQIIIIAVNT